MGIDITVLFDDAAGDERLIPAHGMSCLIEGMESTVLFDTGCDGHILLANMETLGKDPARVDVVVISHHHWDHMGGLWELLRRSGPVHLFIPKSFSAEFGRHAEMLGARVTAVDGPAEIATHVFSTGEMGDKIKEQALILKADEGVTVITGCAHPGIVDIVRRAREVCGGPVHLALGGFHLRDYSEDRVRVVIDEFKRLGVERVGASHCTGDTPIEMFRQIWNDSFVDFTCGAVVHLDTFHASPRQTAANR